MMVVSKPLGGLFRVPDFGLSNVLSKNREEDIFLKKWRQKCFIK